MKARSRCPLAVVREQQKLYNSEREREHRGAEFRRDSDKSRGDREEDSLRETRAKRRLYEMTQDGQFCEKIRDGRAVAISEPGPV